MVEAAYTRGYFDGIHFQEDFLVGKRTYKQARLHCPYKEPVKKECWNAGYKEGIRAQLNDNEFYEYMRKPK